MDLEQRLRASMVAPKPGPMFTARVLARIARGAARRRSRFILMGTVLVVGAAAAMLAWRMSEVPAAWVGSAAIPTVSDPVSAAADPAVHSASDMKEPIAPVSPPEPAPDEVPRQFSVLVMPLRQETQNVAGHRPVQALYAAMVDELRKVPGLTLRVPGGPVPGTGDQADYVLTIASLATTVTPAGGVMMRSTDGSSSCTESGGPEILCGTNPIGGMKRLRGIRVDMDYSPDGAINTFSGAASTSPDSVVWVELKVESRQSAASRYTLPVGVEGAADQLGCDGQFGAQYLECMTPARLAARQVQTLRLQVFPPDAAFQQRVLAQLGNTGQDPTGGMVLSELLQGLARGGGSRLDAGTIRVLATSMSGQPASTRAGTWNTLSRVSHPALIAPLVESLRHDRDQQVRLAALANLAANYSADPVVHRAFEEIDREDPDVVVRATVRQALYGPTQWRADVLAALNDSALPYEARLAPLLVNTTGTPQQEFETSRLQQAVLQERQVLGPLLALIREHLRDADHAPATGSALGRLASVDDPAVFDLFLQLARETSLPFQISSQVGNWAINHRNDRRVREILPQTESTLPSQLLERMKEITEQTGGTAVQGMESPTYGSGAIRYTPPAQ